MPIEKAPPSENAADEFVPALDQSGWAQAPSPLLSQRIRSIFRRRDPVPRLKELVAHIERMEAKLADARDMLRDPSRLLIKERAKLEGGESEHRRIERMRNVVRDFDQASLALECALRTREYVSASYYIFEMQERILELEFGLFHASAIFREADRQRRAQEARASHLPDPKLQARNSRILAGAEQLASIGNVHTVAAIAEAIAKPGQPGSGLRPRTIRHILAEMGFKLP